MSFARVKTDDVSDDLYNDKDKLDTLRGEAKLTAYSSGGVSARMKMATGR